MAPDVFARFAAFGPADEPNGDPTKGDRPGWLDPFALEAEDLHAFQIEDGGRMRWMPCFWGSHPPSGCPSNRDCYGETVHPGGSVVFDSMEPT